jgi:protease-4
MKKFLLGILTGLILACLTAIVVGLSLVKLGERRPTVPAGGVLVVDLRGDIPEKAPVSIPIPFLGGPEPLTVRDIWSTLGRAAADDRIKALVLTTRQLDAGWAKMQELRQNILAFKKSGKPVYAFMEAPRTREYYVASAADRLYTAPEDLVDVKGLRLEMMFIKNTLDKLGIQAEVQHVGKYKDAGDMLTQTSMSPESRESLNLVLDGIYGELLSEISKSRKRSVEEIRAIIDEGPYTAKQAAAKGLTDALRFEDQVFGDLKEKLKVSEIKKVSIRDYLRAIGPERDAKHRIALLVGEGTILRGAGSDAMGTDEGFTSGAFIRMVRRVAADRNIAGVILRVDSPGGDAFASDEILREIKLLRDKKPMVISMSDAAASGGYYVAMTGDPIIAYPSTLTGSIGVLFTKLNLRGLYDKLGIQKEFLTRGKNAAIDTDYAPLTPEARAKLQEGLDEFYREFVSKAAQSRHRKYEEFEPLAQGRVWLGMHAKERGLIDELGGLDRAVELIKQRAKIPAGDKVRLTPYPPKRTWFEQLMRSNESSAETELVNRKIRDLLGGFDYRVWSAGGVLRMMPFQLQVK